ncbi:hypothetical protein WN944_001779 [Citrus x changshan-huyou]|uniref:S-locus receptor kinase C-terminal domain-containing protein n=1 Tax=Citrus x changshan-huyou TaxID=2935761 RepID=A0AAP0QV53_9ROSI
MDPMLQCEASYPTLKRSTNVAFLCVQEIAAHRPSMSEIVSMLTNDIVNLPSPQQPAFSSLKNSFKTKAYSINCITLMMVDGR